MGTRAVSYKLEVHALCSFAQCSWNFAYELYKPPLENSRSFLTFSAVRSIKNWLVDLQIWQDYESQSTFEMKPAVDEYDVRRGIILCNAIKELSTVDGGIPKPQSMPHV